MNPFFAEALDLREHPIKKAKKTIQAEYYAALTYLLEKTGVNHCEWMAELEEYISERMRQYRTQLFLDSIPTKNEDYCSSCFSSCVTKPWRTKYRFMLVCDAALMLLDKRLVHQAASIVKQLVSHRKQSEIDGLLASLFDGCPVEKRYLSVESLIEQYRRNYTFLLQPTKKIIVTANMSAGKSTLINALIGKPVARTSQEVCTGNVYCLFNKAFEDGNVHLATSSINLMATFEDLHKYNWDEHIAMASYFSGVAVQFPRLCIIDTPGVDAALHQEHSQRTHDALTSEMYDTVLYVVSPTRLGTDAEKRHLKWVAQHLPKDKIIFVLNKLDDYRAVSDSVDESMRGLQKDLLEMGFENPIICPISAYFSYLLKLKLTEQPLSEDEADEYALYAKKFMRDAYDLSQYYDGVQCSPDDSQEVLLSKHAGLFGLEKMICGGKT